MTMTVTLRRFLRIFMPVLPFLFALFYPLLLSSDEPLLIFCGAAIKPPMDEIIQDFRDSEGIRVDVNYGSSGSLLSQLLISRRGDIYAPASDDLMETAKEKGIIIPETEIKVVYLVPAINVQRGNPKNIKGLHDLLRPDIRVGIANPETVVIGRLAVEIVEKSFDIEEKNLFKKKVVGYFENCEKALSAIILRSVDAIIGFRVLEKWNPKSIETIQLRKEEVPRVPYISLAVTTFSNKKEVAERFLKFVRSEKGKGRFKKYGYFTSTEEAYTFIGDKKPLGCRYELPEMWLR